MSFFEPPPPPDPPEFPAIPRPPPWSQAPTNELGAPVPLRLVLARTDRVAVALVGAVAYTSGTAFTLAVRWQQPSGDALIGEPWELPFGHHHLLEQRGGGVPLEVLRFGVQFSDGRKATTLSGTFPFTRPGEPEEEQHGPVLSPGGGGGGPGHWDSEFWLWPLPPAGPVKLAVEWPKEDIELTMREVDAAVFLEASKKSEVLWPEQGGGEAGSVSQIVLRSEGETPSG
ncbi:MAG TPA: hypothetical protein VI142_11350 [Gaiellaceae bacterium]